MVPTSSIPLDVGAVEQNPPPPGLTTGAAVIASIGFTPENAANKGAANGYAPLDGNHLVPAANVPGLTGDVVKNAGSNATTVQAIRNYPVTPNAPSDGQPMRWSASAGQWIYVTHVAGETPTGTLDGANAVFTLANAPNPAPGLVLTRNGLGQQSGVDFTLSGNAITFVTAATPQPGDGLLASYDH